MNRSMKRLTLVLIVTAGLVAWPDPDGREAIATADQSGSARGTETEVVVGCGQAIIGQGPRNWRRGRIVAGPVGVNRRPPPLSSMQRSPGGTMVTKMMVLVAGHDAVQISVPDGPNRAWLYYGRKASAFSGDTKYKSVTFHPCKDQKRTIFPGGIRVRGRKSVRLEVTVVGENETHILRLGKPKAYTPK